MANQEVDNGRTRTADREVLLQARRGRLPGRRRLFSAQKGLLLQTCTSRAAVAHFQGDDDQEETLSPKISTERPDGARICPPAGCVAASF